MVSYSEVEARMLEKGCKPDGKTITTWKTICNMNWPAGTNLVVEFIKAMRGLPYGDNGMSLDKSADCSQLVINTLYYWFGIDCLGSYAESIYDAAKKKGKPAELHENKDLLVITYNFKFPKRKHASHVSIKTDANHIWHTRSKIRPLMEDNIDYAKDYITSVTDFLTDEQRASVIIQAPAGGGSKAEAIKYKYTGSGLRIRAKASVSSKRLDMIRKGNIVEKYNESKKWWHVKLGNVTGWCKPNTRYFKQV